MGFFESLWVFSGAWRVFCLAPIPRGAREGRARVAGGDGLRSPRRYVSSAFVALAAFRVLASSYRHAAKTLLAHVSPSLALGGTAGPPIEEPRTRPSTPRLQTVFPSRILFAAVTCRGSTGGYPSGRRHA